MLALKSEYNNIAYLLILLTYRQGYMKKNLNRIGIIASALCLSGFAAASPFEIIPGLWQYVTTITTEHPYQKSDVATDYQVRCLDESRTKAFFPELQQMYQNLNEEHVFDAKNNCTTQNNNSATQIKQTTSCKIPGPENYTSFLLANSFNNQYQYIANIELIHPNVRRIKVKIELRYLGSCIEK